MAGISAQDPVLSRIGNFGKWQARTVGAFSLIGFFLGWHMLAPSIIVPEVEYWCSPPGLGLGLGERVNWTGLGIFSEDAENTVDHCKVLDVDYFNISETQLLTPILEEESQRGTRPCKRWDYDRSTWPETVVSQFDLVCNKEYWRSLSQSLYMFGIMVGSFVSGILSDKFGRKKITLVAAIGQLIFGIAVAFSPSILVFTLLRWCLAVCSISLFTCGYVYCMEIIGGRWGTYVGIGLEIPWSFAYMLLPVMSWTFPTWTHFQLSISIPIILIIILLSIPGMAPESPKWLLTQGRVEEADRILEAAAKMNDKEPQIAKEPVVAEKDGDASSSTLLDLFKTTGLRRATIIMYYLFFTNSFVYYGLTLNSGKLIPGDLHVNIIVSAIFEILANLLTILAFIYVGRRISVFVSMLTGGLTLLIIPLVSVPLGKTILAQIGRFAITGSFSMVFVYAVEIFPTVVRNVGLGSSSTCARVGGVIAPYIGRELAKQSPGAPLVIFGVTSIIASILVLFLPETRNISLPDTILQGESFIREQGGFMLCNRNRKVENK
jgi:OCT family organic cation transporter-like MFS transporter 4/5